MRVSVRDVRLFFEVFGQEWVFSGETLRRRPVLLGLHGGPGVDGTGLRYALAPLALYTSANPTLSVVPGIAVMVLSMLLLAWQVVTLTDWGTVEEEILDDGR